MLDESIKEILKEAVREVIKETLAEQKEVPPVLNQKQVMELLGISRSTASQLFNKEGFPVSRKLGTPRVITSELFKWLNENKED